MLLASGCFHLFVAAKSNFPTETGVRWVLWYFPMRRWDMAPGSALEIPRCCRYGDQLEFEFVLKMNLVQIGTNEFFPQLIRLAAKERHLQSGPYSNDQRGLVLPKIHL